MDYRARFNGRQTYRTARGSERVNRSASLPARFRSRFCTRVPRTFWLAFEFLLLTFVLAGCSRGIHTATGGGLAASTPTAISSSAQVVKLTTFPVSLPKNASADAVVKLSISPGFHINANPATFPYLIATEVQHSLDPNDPLTSGKPVYPVGVKKIFAFAEQPLAVYEGDVTIKLPLSIVEPNEYGHPTRGSHFSFPIVVRVQACDSEKCYPPAMLDADISIDVK